jgi:hypothetical protein
MIQDTGIERIDDLDRVDQTARHADDHNLVTGNGINTGG